MRAKSVSVFSLAAALIIALSACAAPRAATPAAAPQSKAAEATQPAEAPKAEVKTVYGNLPRNETFIVGHQVPGTDVWDSFNPFMPGFNSVTGYINAVMELPFYMDDNTTIYPWLAKEWKYGDEGKSFTLTIVDNANWNDGTPLTIDDWLFTIDYYIKNADKIGAGVGLSNTIASVKADGKDKLVFAFREPSYRFHTTFINGFYILSKAVWEGQDPATFKNPTASGPGPYKLVSTNPETRVVIWERRDDYWNKDKMPAPRYMVWTQAPKQDLSTLEWEQGNYDLGSLESAPVKQAMQKNPDIAQYLGLDTCPRRIAFNHTVKPMDDPAFRHALSLLVDRERAASLGDPPAYLNVVPWPYDPTKGAPAAKFYDPADIDKYDIGKFDPAKAAQILDEAGYKLVDGKRVDKEGKPIQLTAITFQGQYTHWHAWADIMKEEAAKLGIEIEVQIQEASTFVANLPNGQYEISFQWSCPRPDDPISMYEDLMPENYKDVGTPTWQNPYRWKITPELEAMVKQMRVGDPAKPEVLDLYKKAYGLVFSNYVWSPLFGDYFVIPYNNQYWKNYEKGNILVYWGPLFRQILAQITPAQ